MYVCMYVCMYVGMWPKLVVISAIARLDEAVGEADAGGCVWAARPV